MALGTLRAHPDVAVLFYCLDMPKDVMFDRLLCHVSGLDYYDLWRDDGDPNVDRLLSEAEKELAATILPRLRIIEREQLGQGKEAVLGALLKRREELVHQSGTQRALHLIDYFQLLDVADKASTAIEADAQRIAHLQNVQRVTRTPQCPSGDSLLVISEVRKGESGRQRLALDDLLGSARIAYSADCVLLLEADGEATDSAADAAPLLLTVAKGRDGMRRGKLPFSFEYLRYRFRETTSPRIGRAQAAGSRAATGSPPGHVANPLAGGQEG
jgi:replicative DNA helicase